MKGIRVNKFQCHAVSVCASTAPFRRGLFSMMMGRVVLVLLSIMQLGSATNAVTVLFLGGVAATNGAVITITRTYGAVNSCGQTSTCVQVIMVRDIAPPQLTCATVILVSETRRSSTSVTFGPPTVSDNCD